MIVAIALIDGVLGDHHHHQKAFRNKSHTSHGHRPGLKRNKNKGKRLTMNYYLMNYLESLASMTEP